MLAFLFALTVAATAFAYRRGVARAGIAEAAKLFVQVGPVLLSAFLLAGMLSVLVSTESLNRWLGTEAGARGLLLGTVAGALTPGGPFVAFPLIAVLLKGGASVGALTAYLTSWALLGVHRLLAYEVPILGLRFVACRVVASLVIPVLVGLAAQSLWVRFGHT